MIIEIISTGQLSRGPQSRTRFYVGYCLQSGIKRSVIRNKFSLRSREVSIMCGWLFGAMIIIGCACSAECKRTANRPQRQGTQRKAYGLKSAFRGRHQGKRFHRNRAAYRTKLDFPKLPKSRASRPTYRRAQAPLRRGAGAKISTRRTLTMTTNQGAKDSRVSR